MTTLASLWDVSLLLCAAALLAIVVLLVARAVSEALGRRREDLRRVLVPAMLRGQTDGLVRSRAARKVAAGLTIELAELVRGSDRDGLIASARTAGADVELRRRLKSRVPQERLIAAEALAMFPEHAEELATVALHDTNPDVRLGAALALAQEGRAPSPGDLVRGLGIGSTEHSLLAVALMRDLAKHDPQAVEALLYDLELPDAAKLAATDALAESGAVDHAPLVAWMAEASGEQTDLQPRIFRALGRLGHPAGHDAILEGMFSPLWPVRSSAAEAAGRSQMRRAVDRLIDLLDDPEWWVRFRASEALSKLGADGRLALERAAMDAGPLGRTAAAATLNERWRA